MFKQPGTHSSTPYPLVWPPLWFVSLACFHSMSSVHPPPSSSIIHKLNIGSQCISSLLSTFQDHFAPFDSFCPPLPHLISPNDIQAALHTFPCPLPLRFAAPMLCFTLLPLFDIWCPPTTLIIHYSQTQSPPSCLFICPLSHMSLAHMFLIYDLITSSLDISRMHDSSEAVLPRVPIDIQCCSIDR